MSKTRLLDIFNFTCVFPLLSLSKNKDKSQSDARIDAGLQCISVSSSCTNQRDVTSLNVWPRVVPPSSK